MIRFGPAGIPLSCKGRTLRDGIEDVHTLGLNAMEIQLVRTNVIERVASEEELGFTPRTIPEELIVEIIRDSKKKGERIFNLDEKIQKGDTLRVMASAIAKDHEALARLGDLARDLDVELSMHTPYYIDLVSDDDVTQRSVDSVMWGGMLTQELGGSILVTHLGLYGNVETGAAMNRVQKHLENIVKMFDNNGIKVKLGIEPSGRQEVVGSLEEIMKLCGEIDGVVPILNFPHIHARGNGSLKVKEDFQKLFDTAAKYFNGDFYAHFSGVEHEEGNEIRYTPIKKGDLKFEPLAECILDKGYDMTIISGSPLLEHDAMYMKVILERILARRRAKPVVKPTPPKPAAKAAPAKGKKPSKPTKKPAAKSKAKPAPKKATAAKKPIAKPSKKPAAKPVKKPSAAAKPKAKPAPKKGRVAPKKQSAAAKKPVPKPKAKPAPKKGKVAPKKQSAAAKKPVPKPKSKPAPKKAPAKKKPTGIKPTVKKLVAVKKPSKAKPAPKKKGKR
jgi:deoxyribonuclease-4